MNKKKFWINSTLISLLIFFITLILVIFDKFSIDNLIQSYIQQIQNPLMNSFFIFMGNYSEIIMIALAVFFIVLLYLQKRGTQSFILLFSLGVGWIGKEIIKQLIQRERPFPQLFQKTGFSFPSGHSVFAIILFSLIIYCLE